MRVEVDTEYNALLQLMNRYRYPGVKQGVHVVQGRHGELHVCVRPVEAWARWAESNGYNDWEQFARDYEDEIEWSDNGRKGFLDEGGSIEYVEIEGYYRDGREYL